MKYRLEHVTEYRYAQPASLSYNDVCLKLRATSYQTVGKHQFDIQPKPDYQKDRVDFFGNNWRILSFEQSLESMRLSTRHDVEVVDRFPGGLPTSLIPAGETADLVETAPYLWESPYIRRSEEFAAFGKPSFAGGRPLLESVMDLTLRIFKDFEYSPAATTIATRVEEVGRIRKGVCQDFAHYMIAVLRSLDIPARYVSGYLNTRPPKGKEKIRGADASHAWISVYSKGNGWVDFDPTNGLLVRDNHITLAWGRDYGDVAPLKGVVLGGGAQSLRVQVDVQEIG